MSSSCRRGAIVLDLFERYYERVYLFARRSVDPALAEDIAQDVFVRMLSVRGLEGKEISISYLLKIAHNLVRARERREARRAAKRDVLEQVVPRRVGRSLAFGADGRELLAAALSELTEHEREAVRLTVCCGLSLREASEALGVRVTTITNWKYRGLQKLARIGGPVAAA